MNRYTRLALIAALSIVATVRVSQTLAANYSWTVPSGAWNMAGNWSSSNVPGAADTAWVVDGGTANINSILFTLNETCGTVAVGGANSGTVQLGPNLASLTVGSGGELVGYTGKGTFNQTAGTNSTNSYVVLGYNAGSNGSYSLSGGLLTVTSGLGEVVGDNGGSGAFTQTGGTNSTNAGVVLGYDVGSNGSYNLGGSGYLSESPVEYVGYYGSEAFSQTGGTNAAGSVNLGILSAGSYNLSGGLLLAPGGELVGYEFSGSSVFTQTGGTNNVGSALVLGNYAPTVGTYNLNGGLLSLSGLTQGAGSAAFNFSGGTFEALSSFSSSVPIVLGTGGNDVFDSNGNTLTLVGGLSGNGGLTKVGSGMLVLGGASTYSGSMMVTAGTLELLSGNFVTSFTAENGGGLLFSGASINLGSGFVQALTGGNAQYQNAMISGGFLRGPGSHTFLAGSTNSLNGTTIVNGAVVQQSGTTSFTDVTSGGQISDNSNAILTWHGVNNASSGSITVNNSAILNVSEWYNDGFITINNGGVLNNSVTHLASGGGSQILINSGGTLNANSDAQGETLDLQGSLLVNNGTVTGTTNVEYGATVSGSGNFGPINVMRAGAVVAATTAVPAPTSLTVTSGSISGAGNLAVSATVADAILVTPILTDVLTLSGNLSGPGPIIKIGPGTLVLSGTNTFGAGTSVEAGTVLVAGDYALPDGSNLSVGSGIMAFAATVVPAAVAAPTSPVPEPGTLVLLVIGACFAAFYRCLRSRQKK